MSYLWHLPLCSDGVNFQVFPKFHVLCRKNNTGLKTCQCFCSKTITFTTAKFNSVISSAWTLFFTMSLCVLDTAVLWAEVQSILLQSSDIQDGKKMSLIKKNMNYTSITHTMGKQTALWTPNSTEWSGCYRPLAVIRQWRDSSLWIKTWKTHFTAELLSLPRSVQRWTEQKMNTSLIITMD